MATLVATRRPIHREPFQYITATLYTIYEHSKAEQMKLLVLKRAFTSKIFSVLTNYFFFTKKSLCFWLF